MMKFMTTAALAALLTGASLTGALAQRPHHYRSGNVGVSAGTQVQTNAVQTSNYRSQGIVRSQGVVRNQANFQTSAFNRPLSVTTRRDRDRDWRFRRFGRRFGPGIGIGLYAASTDWGWGAPDYYDYWGGGPLFDVGVGVAPAPACTCAGGWSNVGWSGWGWGW